jgi:phosphate transport system permease protein
MDQAAAESPAAPTRGLTRQNRQTRRSVLIADRIADWSITIGGLFVIIAVAAIMVFLAQVVVPLFTGGRIDSVRSYTVPLPPGGVLMANVDEHKTVAVVLGANGGVSAFHAQTGTPLLDPEGFDFSGATPTAFGRTLARDNLIFGFSDGSIRFATLRFATSILTPDALPSGLVQLDSRDQTDGTAVYSRVPGNQFRKVSVVSTLDAPQRVSQSAIVAADYRVGGTVERPTRSFVTADADGIVRLSRAESRVNMLTRQVRTTVTSTTLPELPKGLQIKGLLLTEKADQVLVATQEGIVYRYDTRNFDAPRLAERIRVVPDGEELTGFYFLIGEQTLIITGSRGTVDAWFTLERKDAGTSDGYALVRAHVLERHAGAVRALSAGQRGKTFVSADENGAVWLRHTTSNQVLLRLDKDRPAGAYAALMLTPRADGVLAIAANGRASFWNVDIPHPETTLHTIFGKVWYEGYQGPTFTWQSSAGTDQFEPKLSLVPLIFGTIKATVYAMLFALPIALMGAIYTSEFVHHRVRAVVKPAMEMMASLPSVVLGFIAALILAPIVEQWIAAVLMVFVALPVSLLLAAYAWQLLPRQIALRYGGLPKFALMFVFLAIGFQASLWLGDALEALVFAGDVKLWLDGSRGDGVGFTTMMLTPLSVVVVGWGVRRVLEDRIAAMVGASTRLAVGAAAFARWIATLAAAVALAWVAASLLAGLGYDPRGGIVGTYVQRNTLVVGFAMGFAVIPIIYTISEDALNSVPEHLRAASLACGATAWQTATRVILPTAASGVFAAVMIGMGRAVGETMIVVMAAGNTPIMDWNIFNGLRALSANIAVELPEAVRDGTLYRMLFLAALVLFGMTFVINTLAEVIRQRFRRRAASL